MMKHKIKALGLALAAMLVVGAVMASGAGAAPKSTPENESDYPVTVKGSQVGTSKLELEGGRKIECTTATFEGTVANKAAAEESKLNATPVFEGCTATILGNVVPATVTMHSCLAQFTTTETTTGTIAAEGWEITGNLHVACTFAGDDIQIHVYSNHERHVLDISTCTYTIKPQTPLGSVDYKLQEKNAGGYGTMGATKETITGLAVEKVSGTETNCGAASQSGSLKGEFTVEGFNSGGSMIRSKFED